MDIQSLILLSVAVIVSGVVSSLLTKRILHKKYEVLDGLRTETEQLETKIGDLKGDSDREKQLLKEVMEKIEEAESQVEELLSDKDRAESALQDVQAQVLEAEEALSKVSAETKELQALKGQERQIEAHIAKLNEDVSGLQSSIADYQVQSASKKELIEELQSKVDLYSRVDDLVSYGHFEVPKYLYETSERFAEQIKRVREQQKEMIKSKAAVVFPNTPKLFLDESHGKKVLEGQSKLLMSAFNTECDFLIGGVSPSNYARVLERIEKLANSLEKSIASLDCGINIDYIKLKFDECTLQYQFVLKKQEEQAEQKLIREQIREEQRAIKEYERAIAQAEKEEKMYRQMLEKAREELADSSEEDRIVFEQKISDLEAQLAEAEAKEERAKSMAEQTRKGHVYVISNIGSFGDDVYKIGLTRRLEPMDRVKELGDASVPFSFDVHAMVYVEDAPALESALHREFTNYRVNAVNHRKEFFNVSLDAIKEAVENIAGVDVDFKMTALAEDYYESRRLRAERTEVLEPSAA